MNGFDVQSSDKGFVVIEDYGSDGSATVQEFVAPYSPAYFERNETAVDSWHYAYVKRTIDAIMAFALLLILFVPGVIISAAIIVTSRGPVFYREKRLGRYGRPFRIWKFRSMAVQDSEQRKQHGPNSAAEHIVYRTRKNQHDPRITAVGGFLRRWSLDEIPQILNVLQGQMSMIGPRPIVEAEACFYGDLLPYYLAATPGLSGLWQVSGRSNIDYPKRAALDASYVMDWSLKLDLDIFKQTIPAVLRKTGAC